MIEPDVNGPRRFDIGDRVQSALYGNGVIDYWWRDQNIGWTYHVIFDEENTYDDNVVGLVQSVLNSIPSAVDRLGDLV